MAITLTFASWLLWPLCAAATRLRAQQPIQQSKDSVRAIRRRRRSLGASSTARCRVHGAEIMLMKSTASTPSPATAANFASRGCRRVRSCSTCVASATRRRRSRPCSSRENASHELHAHRDGARAADGRRFRHGDELALARSVQRAEDQRPRHVHHARRHRETRRAHGNRCHPQRAWCPYPAIAQWHERTA